MTSWSRIPASRAGMNRGGWLKSASRLRKKSKPFSMANCTPSSIAVPSPSFPARWIT